MIHSEWYCVRLQNFLPKIVLLCFLQRKKHRRSNSADIATVAAAAATEQSEMETGERQRRFSTPGPATPLHSVDSNANLRDAGKFAIS